MGEMGISGYIILIELDSSDYNRADTNKHYLKGMGYSVGKGGAARCMHGNRYRRRSTI